MSHCATCNCADDGPVQPATSSPGIRRLALQAAADAVRAAKDQRKKPLDTTGWVVPGVVDAEEDELVLEELDD